MTGQSTSAASAEWAALSVGEEGRVVLQGDGAGRRGDAVGTTVDGRLDHGARQLPRTVLRLRRHELRRFDSELLIRADERPHRLVIRGEPSFMVTQGGSQLSGQYIRADEREARSLSRQRG